MRWIGAALALWLALAAGAQAQLIAGRDQLTSRDRLLGWEAVGRLDFGGQGYCTGTLIATDLVLTAAHCLFHRGRAHEPARVTFRAGLRGAEAVAEAGARRLIAHPAYDPAAGTNPANIRHDVALVQLRQPIAAATAAPFGVHPLPSGRVVSVVSYGRGRDEALSWQRACRVLGRQEGLMAVDCDVDFGSSGAPVFEPGGGRRIVGLISSGGRQGDKAVALAMELPGAVAALRQALRRDTGPAPGPRRLVVGEGGGARFLRPPARESGGMP